MRRKQVWIGIAVLVGLCLLIGNTQASTINLIENGGFEEGSLGGDIPYWVGEDENYYWHLCNDNPHFGEQHLESNPSRVGILEQDIDFGYVDNIGFYWWITSAYSEDPGRCLQFKIDDVLYWSDYTHHGGYKYAEIDVSSVEGIRTLTIRNTIYAVVYVDGVTANVERDYTEIVNPSFEKALSNNPHVQWDSWTDVDTSDTHSESATQSTDYAHSGTHSLKLYASIDGSGSTAAGVTQKIDISSSTPYLNFRMFSEGAGGTAGIIVTIDDNNVWQYSSATTWDEFAVPLSGYNGVRDISIYAIAQGASASNITAYIDTVSFGSLQEIVLKGKVYDAVTGGVLSGVVVDCSQMGGVATDTTDAMGNYEITGLFTNYDIYLDASKTDYNHHQTYFHFSTGGTKTINIYMLPYTEHGLYGLVIDHNGEAVPAASVKVWNTTWDDTTTTNSYGYFCFKNLTGLYEIQGSKAGMQASSIETITMEDLITTLDNCEAVTGWNSSGSVAINSTLKKQGSYSVRCNDTDALLCNKTFSPAKNTNLTYGKLQFWAYIENSSAISTLEVSLIDSSTDYRKWTGLSGTNGWNYFELWIPDASGTADLTDIVKFEVNAIGSGEIVVLFDEIKTFEPATDFVFLTLYGFFTLTVSAKNIDTAESIMSFTATLDGAFTEGTTTGVVSFTQVVSGLHTVYVSAEGYYGGTGSPYVWHNMTYAVYLLSTGEAPSDINVSGGAGVFYPPPHLVEFRLQNIYGNPISDVTVTAFGVQTTMGVWTWLYSIFGYKNETQIHNTTMNGTTDVMGHLSFLMIETVKYKIDFVKESEGINKTMYFYPKESQYLIVLTPTIQPDMIDYVNWNLSVEEISGDSANRSLNFTYSDNMSKTSQICFFVRDENKTEIYSNCSFADNSSVDTGCKVAKSSGATYFWGFNATHDTFGGIKGSKAVTFKGRLIDLQLANENYYTWISIALLVMITSLFSAVTVKFGYIVVPFMSALFYEIGWLEIAPTLLTVIIILGILLFMGRRERESGL